MFTGLVEEIGTVAEIRRGGSIRLAVRARKVLDGLKLGDSIAVSGPCLTVEEIAGDRFWASLLPETASGTTLGELRQGDRVNLERPLRLGDRLGGHMVSGHIDGVGTVRAARTARETARTARETARTARQTARFGTVRHGWHQGSRVGGQRSVWWGRFLRRGLGSAGLSARVDKRSLVTKRRSVLSGSLREYDGKGYDR